MDFERDSLKNIIPSKFEVKIWIGSRGSDLAGFIKIKSYYFRFAHPVIAKVLFFLTPLNYWTDFSPVLPVKRVTYRYCIFYIYFS